MQIQPYLFFDGRCEEAAEFYQAALGAEVAMVLRYKDAPPGEMPVDPTKSEKIMHMALRIGGAMVLCSDGHCTGKPEFKGFGLSLTATDAAEAARMFAALSAGGQVQMPLAKTFFAPVFGMVTDKFGVMWMVLTEA